MEALNCVRTYTLIDHCSPFYSNSTAMSGQNHRSNPHTKSRQVRIEKYLTVGRNHFAKPCFSNQRTGCIKSWENARFQAKSHGMGKSEGATYGQDITPEILNGFGDKEIFCHTAKRLCQRACQLRFFIRCPHQRFTNQNSICTDFPKCCNILCCLHPTFGNKQYL